MCMGGTQLYRSCPPCPVCRDPHTTETDVLLDAKLFAFVLFPSVEKPRGPSERWV